MKIESRAHALDKLHKRRDRLDIPDWQREKVWSVARKQALIDSILRGWKLPKLYFLVTNNNPLEYDVVDGQQRLTAIFDFFEDELTLSDESAAKFGAHFYSQLPDAISDRFDDFELQIDEIEEATDKEIKDFFQRLQQGLPLSASEKLNSVDSKLRNFCKTLSGHDFFAKTTKLSAKRFAYFDVVSKAAAIEVEGLDVGFRYNDLKKVFEAQANFAANSLVAKRMRAALDFLHSSLPAGSNELRNRAVVQSLITLACSLVEAGVADQNRKVFARFTKEFMHSLSSEVEKGSMSTDSGLMSFQKTINANVRSGAKTRHQILLSRLLQFAPKLSEALPEKVLASAGVQSAIVDVAREIGSLIETINDAHSSKHGKDLFKATNKTVAALTAVGKVANDHDTYKKLVERLYFLVWEGPGSKLKGKEPQSFLDVRDLRTELEHDVDHGSEKDVAAKKLKLAAAFKKYSGVSSPTTAAPERFPVTQLALLSAVRNDLKALLISI